jgi:predicted RNase H-like HicB family nuclease
VVEVKTYTAVAERSGDWWAVSVPEVRGVFTQARRLEQVAPMAREAIALLIDAPEDTIEVEVDVKLPDNVEADRERVRDLRGMIDTVTAQYREALAALTDELTSQIGLSMRDAAELAGVSFQRVSQILSEPPIQSLTVRYAAKRVTPQKATPARKAAPAKVAARKAAPQTVTARKAAAAARKAAPRKAAAAARKVASPKAASRRIQ